MPARVPSNASDLCKRLLLNEQRLIDHVCDSASQSMSMPLAGALHMYLRAAAALISGGTIHPFAPLRLTADDSPLTGGERLFRNVGVFGCSANPITLGHLLALLSAIVELRLDVVVFVPQGGALIHKPCAAHHQVPEGLRFRMATVALRWLRPLVRVSTISRGTDSICESSLQTLRELNSGRYTNWLFLSGSESAQRLTSVTEGLIRFAKPASNCGDAASVGWILRCTDEATVRQAERKNAARLQHAGFNPRCFVIETPPVMSALSSGCYRQCLLPAIRRSRCARDR